MHIRDFPKQKWHLAPTEFWLQLSEALTHYTPPPSTLTVKNPDRKWEITSAYQKMIRRGDWAVAQRLVSAMFCLPAELPYFWKRVPVVAAEDIGLANVELTQFVFACSAVYGPKSPDFYKVFCFLTHIMCDAPARSRVTCSYSVIEGIMKLMHPNIHNGWTESTKAAMAFIAKQKLTENTPYSQWLAKSEWRGEGMLQYLRMLDVPLTPREEVPMPEVKLLFGLPNLCYDMHTRVGMRSLTRLTGVTALREFYAANPYVKKDAKMLGWLLFFAEGGRLQGELVNEGIAADEQYAVRKKFSLSPEQYLHLSAIVVEQVTTGKLDQIRLSCLNETYPS